MARRDTAQASVHGWPRAIAAFGLLFTLYQSSEYLQAQAAAGQVIGPALMLIMLLAAWPLGRWQGWRGYDAYGLDLRTRSLFLLLCGLVLAVATRFLALVAGERLGVYIPAQQIQTPFMTTPVLASVLLSTFVPSVAEDILTRGFLLRAFPLKLGAWSFVLLSAGLYTANHVWRFDWGWTEQLRLFCMGLAYAAAAWRWQSLWAAIALHWGWNLGNALAGGLLPVEVADLGGTRLISALAHLILLGLVLLLPGRRVNTA